MGTTPLSKNGTSDGRLTDKERKFVHAYAASLDGKKAAIEAGYAKTHAKAQAGQLLKRPKVRRAIGKLLRQDLEELELDRHECLRQLYFALTRRVDDFFDLDGNLLAPDKLPEQCQNIVDGLKVKTRTFDRDGMVETVTEYEYKITPHATAREQALKHLGLIEPDVHQHNVMLINWGDLVMGNGQPVPDEIEARLIEEEGSAKTLPDKDV